MAVAAAEITAAATTIKHSLSGSNTVTLQNKGTIQTAIKLLTCAARVTSQARETLCGIFCV